MRKTTRNDRTQINQCDNCGELFHNEDHDPAHVNLINKILLNNRNILESLAPATIAKSELIERGFNFEHFTSMSKAADGKMVYGCYEFELISLGNDLYRIGVFIVSMHHELH